MKIEPQVFWLFTKQTILRHDEINSLDFVPADLWHLLFTGTAVKNYKKLNTFDGEKVFSITTCSDESKNEWVNQLGEFDSPERSGVSPQTERSFLWPPQPSSRACQDAAVWPLVLPSQEPGKEAISSKLWFLPSSSSFLLY